MSTVETYSAASAPVEASGCDIYAPTRADRKLDTDLVSLQVAWRDIARYQVTLSAEGNWHDKTVIAKWLTYDEATEISGRLDRAFVAKNPCLSDWTRPSYGILLHVPSASRTDKAAVGDLLLHEVIVPHGDLTLNDAHVYRQFFIAAVVTAIDDKGRILSFSDDKEGEHGRTLRKPHVVSASAVDVQMVIDSIAKSVAEKGRWAGEFGNIRSIQALLVRCQRIKAPVYPQYLDRENTQKSDGRAN